MGDKRLVVLGTASQVPTRHRNHNGYFLKWDHEGFLFDPGEGTQRQMLFSRISSSEITRICITHFHGDHCLGLPGVVQRLSLDRAPHKVEIYYPASGQVYLERLRRASIFHDTTQIIQRPLTRPGVVGSFGNVILEAYPLDHSVESWGYRIREPETRTMLPEKLKALGIQGPAIGQLKREGQLEIEGRTVSLEEVSVHKRGQIAALVMDTRVCENAVLLGRDADLLICESTYLATETREAVDHGHLTALQAAEIAREANAKHLVLTHFSRRYTDIQAFVTEAKTLFPKVTAVRDGDIIPMKRPGRDLRGELTLGN